MTSEFPEPIEPWTAKPRVTLRITILKGENSVAEAARMHGLTVAEVQDSPATINKELQLVRYAFTLAMGKPDAPNGSVTGSKLGGSLADA